MAEYERMGEYQSSQHRGGAAGVAITFLLIGLGAGALVALLIAPQEGKKTRRLLRRIAVDGDVEVMRRPPVFRVRSELARTDTTATACVLYAAALEELVRSYVGERPQLQQRRCASQGAPFCEWSIAET